MCGRGEERATNAEARDIGQDICPDCVLGLTLGHPFRDPILWTRVAGSEGDSKR